MERGGGSDPQRVQYAFRRCLQREPNERESAELLGLLDRQSKRYSSGELKAAEMTGGVDDARLAAWTAVARVLLNLDETITKE